MIGASPSLASVASVWPGMMSLEAFLKSRLQIMVALASNFVRDSMPRLALTNIDVETFMNVLAATTSALKDEGATFDQLSARDTQLNNARAHEPFSARLWSGAQLQ